ncbi:chromosome segregation protein SMC [bacterium]|nr:chromosome segregation protein SMC [bacterium]
MFLKKLSIAGFKSFPDPLELNLREGMTAIVGPNGCGKTNLSDAIRWALGEQRVRSLRGKSSVDVIFSGTEERHPLGMSEVSLLLANEDNRLPVEYEDVLITRRLFRSGESAYLLNQRPCRLKDIQNLLLDTGIGTNAYSIIEQAQVDLILSQNPHKRREIFDEAAGIGRYKNQRAEATKKLEQTEGELQRLNDRLDELTTQLRGLKREVNKAQHYKRLGEELRQVEAYTYRFHWDNHQSRSDELNQGLETAQDKQAELAAKLASADAALTEAQEEQLRAQNTLTEGQQQSYHSLEQVKNFENRLSLSREKQAERTRRKRELEQRLTELGEEQSSQNSELTAGNAKAAELREELETVRERITASEEELAGLRDELLLHRGEAKQLGVELLDAAGSGAERQLRLEGLGKERDKLRLEEDSNAEELMLLEENLSAKQVEVDKLRGRLDALEERLKEALELQRNANRQIAEVSEKTRRSLDALTRARASFESLERVYHSNESFKKAVRAVLAAGSKGSLSGIHGALAQLVSCDSQYEIAIETALGASSQAIVCDTEADARAAVELLKRLRVGRARFFPLDIIRPRKQPYCARQIQHPGLIDDALALIHFDSLITPAVEFALGGTLVADTLASATDLVRSWRGQVSFRRIVSLDGELVESSGAITGGDSGKGRQHLLSHERDLDKLRENLVTLQEEYDTARAEEKRLRDNFSRVGETLSGQREQQSADSLEWERAKVALERQQEEQQRLEKTEEDRLHRLREVEEELKLLNSEAEATDDAPDEEELRERHSEALNKAERLEARLNQRQEEFAAIREARNRHEVELEGLEKEIERLKRGIAQSELRREKREQELAEVKDASSRADSDLEELSEKLSELTLSKDEEEKQLGKLRLVLNKAGTEFSGKLAERTKLDTKVGEVEKQLTNLRVSLEHEHGEQERLIAEALERTALKLDEVALPEDFELTDSHKSADKLRRRRERLGQINFSAQANYDAIMERKEFLNGQSDELNRGANSLRASIRRLNTEATERFLTTFNQVVSNFERLFSQIFGGGEARLSLTDEEPLEAGVEIHVRPPGKGEQSLIARSGGERALTAIALLFALFEAKPSPFCILDEIDAPLDDANVDRFLKLLGRFSTQSQFLLITHNRRTMESADTLIGVTMDEPGVSRVYSLAFQGGQLITEEDQRSFSLKQKRKK